MGGTLQDHGQLPVCPGLLARGGGAVAGLNNSWLWPAESAVAGGVTLDGGGRPLSKFAPGLATKLTAGLAVGLTWV